MAARTERWDRDRFMYEQERDRGYPDERAARLPDDRSRFEERDGYRPPPRRGRDHSDERFDRVSFDRRRPTAYDEDLVRDRPGVEEDRHDPRRGEPLDREFERRLVLEKETVPLRREPWESSPVRRPTMVRRQSSLDTFDRRPPSFFQQREEYPVPARREDVRPRDSFDPHTDYHRAYPYGPIPLPRTRQLGPAPSARYDYDDPPPMAHPVFSGENEMPGTVQRVKQHEVVTSRRRRDRSRDSKVSRSTKKSSHRSSSRSSSTSSKTTSSSSSATTVRSAYPKKGKTRIPARLVSTRALIDLGYPYTQEGNIVIVQKALGQENIDELLKISEEYKQCEREVEETRSSAGQIVKERHEEMFTIPPAGGLLPPPPPPTTAHAHAHAHPPPRPASVAPPPVPPPAAVAASPVIVREGHHHHHHLSPPPPPPPPAQVEVVNNTTIIRDASPARSTTSYTTSAASTAPTFYERREFSEGVPIGPMAVAERRRSRSRSRKAIRSEIKALEAELHERRRYGNREVVRAEQMPNGAVVLFEEKVEKIEEPRRGIRIEKDKKGPPPKLMRAMLATLT